MKYARQLLEAEIKAQREKWGLEHDIEQHGAAGLAEAACIIAGAERPRTDEYLDGPYSEDQWFIRLWHKHKGDPSKRYAIAAAMLLSAIECAVYEKGLSAQR